MNGRALILWMLAVGCAGCRPGVSAPGDVKPPSARTILTGSVRDSQAQPLAAARVEIVDGRDAGRSATTDTAGSFSLKGTFGDATLVRASPNGYADTTASVAGWWPPHLGDAERSIGFTLAPPSVLRAGDEFTLTLAADDACTAVNGDTRFDIELVRRMP